MTTAAGLALALVSSFALNWAWLIQHGAVRELPPLSARRPVASLRILFGDRSWVSGFVGGIGGWVLYVAALALAPLSLVQAISAGGVGVLAALAHRRGDALARLDWSAVSLAIGGLLLICISLAGGASNAAHADPSGAAVWLGASAVVAAATFARRPGIAAGTLYAAGDVATKGAVFGGWWLILVPILLLAHSSAFVVLQVGFQHAGALETAGVASLLTNALPIAAGVVLFHEQLPGGVLGGVRVAGFILVVLAAGMLSRRREVIIAPA
jgi:hypothetical protein